MTADDSAWPNGRTHVAGLGDNPSDSIEQLERQAAGMSLNELGNDQEANDTDSDGGSRTNEQHSTSDEILDKLMATAEYRKDLYISYCSARQIKYLESLFSSYHDNFASMTDEEGNNGILLVAAEEDGVPTIKWLRDHGVQLPCSNMYGRTALMEAALWGRAHTVKYLIATGVDTRIQDANGMRAIDLARDHLRNQAERISRAGGGYREAMDASRYRRIVVNYLDEHEMQGAPMAEIPAPVGNLGFFQRLPNGHLALFKGTTLLEVPADKKEKAFATMDRGFEYPVVNAMSGYSNSGWNEVLDNSEWTEKALKFCRLIGHNTTKSFASHVEKQLVAYLFDRHCLGEEDYGAMEPDDVMALQEMMPPSLPVGTIIAVSKDSLCSDCVEFFRLLNIWLEPRYNIDIDLRTVSDTM
ncbi:hypothetical protein LTR17_014746 [Elasticomyces elasticus]|nr:hypothetical protein LTR17_014746 [Elasticomyces elasticus]